MTHLIYATHKLPPVCEEMLKNAGFIIDFEQEELSSKEIRIRSLSQKKYEGVISLLTDKIDKETIDACPSLKIIANYAVGYNNIDTEYAHNKHIVVTNTPGTSSRAVAEHTVGLMLSTLLRINEGDEFVRGGTFKGFDPTLLIGEDLTGKTVGLVGLGEIGKEVAQIVHDGFRAKIIYTDLTHSEELESNYGAQKVELSELCEQSDVVSLHVPLLPSTKHLISKEQFLKMKPTAVLINTARGPVIDEEALIQALYEGRISGAGLDVFEYEPCINEKLFMFKNVTLTPHIASARKSVREAMAKVVANNIISFFKEGKALHPVTH